jgi:integrase
LQITVDEYILARDLLIEKDLIAFNGSLFQVLALPQKPRSSSPGALKTAKDMQTHDPPPFRPMSSNTVGYHITKAMRKVGLSSTAYWLRHTYAQNLLESGASIFEIKEMLGHDKIESTKLYLHVHLKLMRKGLFDETF